MKIFTPYDKQCVEDFRLITGHPLLELDRYLTGEWDWPQLWDYNFDRVDTSHLKCRCTFEGLRASGRRKGYPLSIRDLEALGCHFVLIGERESWYSDAYYLCACGQKWQEEFVEAMQYNGNHAYPIGDFKSDA